MTRKDKLEKALAFSEKETMDDMSMLYDYGGRSENRHLALLHVALIEAVEALEFYGKMDNWIDDKFRPREDVELSNSQWSDPSGKKAREALAKIDRVLGDK